MGPIEMDESAKEMAMLFKSKEITAAVFNLGKNQTLHGEKIEMEKKADEKEQMNTINTVLDKVVEPRYVLFTFSHRKGKSNIFLYYCPEKADRNLKFTYSTCKINIVEFLKIAEIPVDLKLEETATKELIPDYILDTLFPRKAKSTTFSKPTMPNRKR